MNIVIRQTGAADVHTISEILIEAESWLEKRGIPLWNVHDLSEESLREDVASGLYILADTNGKSAGTLKYTMTDPLCWPDAHDGESAFVHRVAVRRDYAGGTVSTAMLKWAVDHTRVLGRRFLRLDCEISRNKLREIYERFGFQYHSDKHIGPYHVARYEYTVLKMAT
ncbi:MAG: GNAT family N-acetyltransferase [Bacteroidota bacterium]|jgi:GNAT superfamily N-acetyltransferase